MRCPDDLELQGFFDGELPLRRTSQIEKHCGECPVCQHKLAELDGVVSFIKKWSPDSSVPRIPLGRQIEKIFPKRLVLAAAVVIIIVISGSWIYKVSHPPEWSPETEIFDQYVILYHEDSSPVSQ